MKINDGRVTRIPEAYSDDLHRAIRWMLTKDVGARPSVDELVERLPCIRSAAREAGVLTRE